jgi:signal transduction histidine kinase
VKQRHALFDRSIAGIDFATLKTWLSSPRAVGVWLALFIFVYPIGIGSLQTAPDSLELPIPTWLWDLSTGMGASVVILTSRFWLKSHGLRQTLLVWLIASFSSAVVPIAVSWLFAEVPARLVFAVPVAALYIFGLLILFTIVVATFSEYRVSNRELSIAVAELEFRRASLSGELRQRQEALTQEVLNQVSPRIEGVTQLVQSSQNKVAAAEILSLIDNLVRPVSKGLSESESEYSKGDLEPQANPGLLKRLLRSQARKVSLASIFTPYLHVIFAIVFFTDAMSLVGGFTGIAVFFGFLAIIAGVYLAAARLSREVKLPYLVLHLINLVLAAIVGRLFVEFTDLFGVTDQDGLVDFVGFGLLLVFGFAGFISIYVAGREAANRELLLVAQRLSAIVGELQLRTAALRKQLGLKLHGDMQARLHAALVRLSRDDEPSRSEIEQVLGDLESARNSLLFAKEQTQGLTQFDELVVLWEGICDVTINIDNEARISLSNSDDLCNLVVEIVRERITNAVKHSSAEEIDISILETVSVITISTRNQDFVHQQKTAPIAGGGSKLLDAACSSWSLDFEAGDVVFEAEILVK